VFGVPERSVAEVGTQTPAGHWPLRILIGLVRGYRYLLSPWLGSSCRFEPTCSAYALDALRSHGAAEGSYLTARRLARCHPWCRGGLDPVPETRSRLFGRLLPHASVPPGGATSNSVDSP
jgi:uncharacterized protein